MIGPIGRWPVRPGLSPFLNIATAYAAADAIS
jgi:hypothetical protein